MFSFLKITLIRCTALVLAFTPFVALAQYGDPALSLIFRIGVWVNTATPVAVGLALLAFFWGLAKFIFSAGDEEKRKEGKKVMGWGIVALFVVVAIWGIVFFISIALGVGIGGSAPSPCVEGVPGCNPYSGSRGGGGGGSGFFFNLNF